MATRAPANRPARTRGLGARASSDHLDGKATVAAGGSSLKTRGSRMPLASATAAAAGGTISKASRSASSSSSRPLVEVTNRARSAASSSHGLKDAFEKQPAKAGAVTKVRAASRLPAAASQSDYGAHTRKRSETGSVASSSSSNLASIQGTAARMNAAMEIDEDAQPRALRSARQPSAKRVVRKATSAISVGSRSAIASLKATVRSHSAGVDADMDTAVTGANIADGEEADMESGLEDDEDLHDSELDELEGMPSDTDQEDAMVHDAREQRAASSSDGSASDVSSAVGTGTAQTTPWLPPTDKFEDAYTEDDLDLDPECIVHIRPEFHDAVAQKKAFIIARYEQEVVGPQAEEARLQRQALLQSGQISLETAALDDELAIMGLDPDEVRDTTMVAEYSDEIFRYMSECETNTMAKPNYMDFQTEIQWYMRQTLVDWLLQVHVRYHMLPETLWIAVNIIDRFLSMRVVALQKLQLVGVTSMFIAAKYEEILAPSVEEFVFMTENGYSKEEILKGERIILSTLDFNISKYCTPYSWLRRISKADDYDIHSRTLAKFLMEVTLTDHRFLRAKPSMIAAMSMLLAKKMLGQQWNDAFVYYSRFTEQELVPGANLVLERLIDPSFEEQFVCKKYSNRKFLKASIYAREWALQNHRTVAAAAAAEAGEDYESSS